MPGMGKQRVPVLKLKVTDQSAWDMLLLHWSGSLRAQSMGSLFTSMLLLPGKSGMRQLFTDLLRSSADSVPTSSLRTIQKKGSLLDSSMNILANLATIQRQLLVHLQPARRRNFRLCLSLQDFPNACAELPSRGSCRRAGDDFGRGHSNSQVRRQPGPAEMQGVDPGR